MKQNSSPLLLLALLTGCYVTLVAGTASQLPERVATQFGLHGGGNWMSRGATAVGFEVLAFVPVLIAVLALVMGRLPTGGFNLPHRDYWLAPERRAQTVAWLSRQLLWMGCLMILFMAGIYWLIVLANRVTPPQLPMNLFVPLLAGLFGGIAIWIVRLYIHFRKPSG